MLQRFENRRGILEVFMKELNKRISIFINDRFDRRRTMWESPYGSLLVQGNEGHLLEAAAYIDLNPVRAKMVKRPEDYRFCGYAEALGGKGKARKRYEVGRSISPNPDTGEKGRAGFSEAEVEKVEQAEGEMPVPEVLRHRVRYFTAGVVIGSQNFVEEVFQKHRHRFGATRKTGARKMRGANWGNRYCLRDLKSDVIGPYTILPVKSR